MLFKTRFAFVSLISCEGEGWIHHSCAWRSRPNDHRHGNEKHSHCCQKCSNVLNKHKTCHYGWTRYKHFSLDTLIGTICPYLDYKRKPLQASATTSFPACRQAVTGSSSWHGSHAWLWQKLHPNSFLTLSELERCLLTDSKELSPLLQYYYFVGAEKIRRVYCASVTLPPWQCMSEAGRLRCIILTESFGTTWLAAQQVASWQGNRWFSDIWQMNLLTLRQTGH